MKPLLVSLVMLLVSIAGPLAQPAASAERPNIILMLADDQGWNGLSVAMHPEVAGSKGEFYHTPHLERLAAQGMRFSAAYAPASVCSPTRISLQTGKSPAQLHWTKAAPPETGQKLLEPKLIKAISNRETTVGELLRSAGYATAHFGKWHISGGGPGDHGYDAHDGDTGNEYAFKFTDPNPADLFGMADRAAAFMEKSQRSKKPFCIQLSWTALHASGNALKATQAKYAKLAELKQGKAAEVAAITEDLDTAVGRVLAAVERLNLSGNTYVIYTSDNGSGGGGGRGRRDGLSGGKGSVWEGGIRVPLIVRGPGVAANSWCHTRVVGFDFLPTFCEWAGIDLRKLPPGIEGGSIASLLANHGRGEVRRPREELVFHFPHYQSSDGPHSAILYGPYKLIKFYETDRVVLFDLSKDLSERNDLAARQPADAARLRQALESYLTSVNAQLPTRNPDYSPDKPAPNPKKGMKKADKGKNRMENAREPS